MKNILFVFCDQMRADAIHAMGNEVIHTPVLDSLIHHGCAFSNAYTPCPVCVPARYSLHTGCMPHETGVYENYTLPDPSFKKSFMQCLSENGYQTFGAGKMHFLFPQGHSELWGFDERKVCDEDENLEKNDFYQDLKEAGFGHVYDYKGVRSEMYYIPQVSQLPQRLQHSHWTADKCIDFLDNKWNPEKPFFIMTSFEKPHPPFEPPVPWNKLYRGPDMPMPKNAEDNDDVLTVWSKFQNRYKYRDKGEDRNLTRQTKAHYYAEISHVDYNVGRVLDKLREKGCLEDTLIIFTADHGEMLGDYGCYGKRSFLDSAANIPMIMVVPGQDKPIVCDTPVSLIDIFPTLMEYAGIENGPETPGVSLLKTMRGENDREFVVGEYQEGEMATYMLRNQNYKYIYSVPDQKEYLFDEVKDPDELKNRARNPLYIKKTDELRQQLIAYLTEHHHTDAIENGQWKKMDKITVPEEPDAYLLFQDPVNSIPHIPGYTDDANQKNYYEFHWLSDNFDGK